jgi:death on curing protein
MILIEDILNLHEKSLEDYGGGSGIRDIGLLESDIARPFQTFGGKDLYPDAFSKAAALGESLIINHPFVDGNKRTGIAGLLTLLMEYHYKVISMKMICTT